MSYHPNYALLAAYAEGGLDSAHGLAISAHLEICPHCRDLVHEIENLVSYSISKRPLLSPCQTMPTGKRCSIRLWPCRSKRHRTLPLKPHR